MRAAGDGGPGAPAAAASGGLPFGGEHRAVDVATRRAAQQLGRRRIELVRRPRPASAAACGRTPAGRAPFSARSPRPGPAAWGRAARLGDLGAVTGEREAHRGGVEEVRRGLEPVTEAADALEREPGRLGLPQELRNAGARQPHLRGEVFARVELAVRKLAQQRETERSKHLPSSARSKALKCNKKGRVIRTPFALFFVHVGPRTAPGKGVGVDTRGRNAPGNRTSAGAEPGACFRRLAADDAGAGGGRRSTRWRKSTWIAAPESPHRVPSVSTPERAQGSARRGRTAGTCTSARGSPASRVPCQTTFHPDWRRPTYPRASRDSVCAWPYGELHGTGASGGASTMATPATLLIDRQYSSSSSRRSEASTRCWANLSVLVMRVTAGVLLMTHGSPRSRIRLRTPAWSRAWLRSRGRCGRRSSRAPIFFGGLLLAIGFLTRPAAVGATIALLGHRYFHWIVRARGCGQREVAPVGRHHVLLRCARRRVPVGRWRAAQGDLPQRRTPLTTLLRATGAAYCGPAQLAPATPCPWVPFSRRSPRSSPSPRTRNRRRRTSSPSMRNRHVGPTVRRVARAPRGRGVRGRRLPRAGDGAGCSARRAADFVAARHRVRQPPDPVRRADRARLRRVRVRAALTRLPARAAEV